MKRHGLRVVGGEGYGWPKHVGDVISYGNSSREQVEEIRANATLGQWCEVVELDNDGQVIEP